MQAEPITFYPTTEAKIREIIREELKAVLTDGGSNFLKPADQLFNVTQAAEYLTLAKSTIYSLVSDGKLPNLKKGKRVYFLKDSLLEYLQSGSRKSYSQLAEEARS